MSNTQSNTFKMTETLKIIAGKLNSENISWALGASMMLYFHKMLDAPNDIDLIVSVSDIDKAENILSSIGSRKSKTPNDKYLTRYFYEYVVNGVDVDLMAGFRIKTDTAFYEYEFNEYSQIESTYIGRFRVHLTPIEDWYLLYQLMDGRDEKVLLIENHLRKNGITHTKTLKAALEIEIPASIKRRIKKLLK